jgi:hypothetical protein
VIAHGDDPDSRENRAGERQFHPEKLDLAENPTALADWRTR